MSSVRSIEKECNKMMKLCDSLERIDIYYAKTELEEKLNLLLYAYAKETDYNEYEIRNLKEEVEHAAIKLEYILSSLDQDLHNRYNDRIWVCHTFNKIYELIHITKSISELGNLIWDYAQMDKMLHASKRLLFELTQEQRELIQIIQDRYKNK
ncbi:MAG: hypothetical protein HFI05_00225 [Lachnospiraceae bacterium]|jgi:hypothetical protein|nr:hypothetical protein [Lachnospiraceae bacterium]